MGAQKRSRSKSRPELKEIVLKGRVVAVRSEVHERAARSHKGRFPDTSKTMRQFDIILTNIKAKRVNWKKVDLAINYLRAYTDSLKAYNTARKKFIQSWERIVRKEIAADQKTECIEIDVVLKNIKTALEQIEERRNE